MCVYIYIYISTDNTFTLPCFAYAECRKNIYMQQQAFTHPLTTIRRSSSYPSENQKHLFQPQQKGKRQHIIKDKTNISKSRKHQNIFKDQTQGKIPPNCLANMNLANLCNVCVFSRNGSKASGWSASNALINHHSILAVARTYGD